MSATSRRQRVVPVYDEPRHNFYLRNEFVNVYDIELPVGEQTLFHRHDEDTVYFAISNAAVEESFLDKPAVLTQAPCGGTLSRPHRDEPLIHQVRNVGNNTMHMLGAEWLKAPQVTAGEPSTDRHHSLLWESSRFRVYELHGREQETVLHYGVYGVLVALEAMSFRLKGLGSASPDQRALLKPGSFLWITPPLTVEINGRARGFFAEWR